MDYVDVVTSEKLGGCAYHWVGQRLGSGCTVKFDYFASVDHPEWPPLLQGLIDHPGVAGHTELKRALLDSVELGAGPPGGFQVPAECV